MIVSRILGGLGNQLFQWAIAKALSKKLNTPFSLDIREFESYRLRKYELDSFNLKVNFFTGDPKSLVMVRESKASFDDFVYTKGNNIYLFGYWQDPKYFEGLEGEIRKDLFIDYDLKDVFSLAASTGNSVAVHIRRTDYLRKDVQQSIGNCSLNYYYKALELLGKEREDIRVFVFSDDINWCRDNFKPSGVSSLSYVEEKDPVTSMRYMSFCRDLIIANSTMSWWAAFLTDNPKRKVIIPTPWYTDKTKNGEGFYLPGWVKLPK